DLAVKLDILYSQQSLPRRWLTRPFYEQALALLSRHDRGERTELFDAMLEGYGLIPPIKQAMTLLNDLTSGPMGLPFASGPGRGGARGFLDTLAAMLDESGIEPEDIFGPGFEDDDESPPSRAPRPRGKGKTR
ncbi:MAG: hypothetical protein LC745_13610, partial [Planctomycetia bacterium]|nr:hypothetical protein [Planctomycetia bacterium]